MEHEVVDVMVFQDGFNKPFFSYMNAQQASEIVNCGGLSQAECINLRETEDRPVPQELKDGQSTIIDVLVRLEPNRAICLN